MYKKFPAFDVIIGKTTYRFPPCVLGYNFGKVRVMTEYSHPTLLKLNTPRQFIYSLRLEEFSKWPNFPPEEMLDQAYNTLRYFDTKCSIRKLKSRDFLEYIVND
jgi:hypothetical protein